MEETNFYITDLANLPWPQAIFRCRYTALFDAAIREVPADRPESAQPLVENVARSLTPEQLSQCDYHRPDWVLAAELAIDCWRERGSVRRSDIGVALDERLVLSDDTRWAAESFFIEPIWIDGPLLGNGQHRICAMKLAGVRRCLVER
ncbi:MAG TPA: hypothetical protein VHZ54_02285 [Solirubrobacterales bacterium]|nr:hypothetical protein [Solirubrobacterales bacterium]